MINYGNRNLPAEWGKKKLSQVVHFWDNKRVPIKEGDRQNRQGPYPYYGASGIIDYIDEYIFDEDLILLAEDGANILARSTPIAFKATGKYWVNNHAHILKPKSNADIDYLIFYLESLSYHKYNSGAAQPKLNREVCTTIPVIYPPLPEQKAIAALLSTWDEAIEKTERLIQAKEKLLNGLYQHYFVPESSSNMHWEKVKIGRVLKQRNKKALPSDDQPLFSLTIEDGVTAKTDRYNREALVKDNGSKKYKIVCPNDIVFNPANLRWGAIARSTVPHEVVISPIYEVLSVKNDAVDIDFISHLLTCPRQIGIYATKTEGTLIERMAVKLDAFLLLDIYLPPEREEQQEISNILNAAQHEINLLKQLAEKYKTQKRGLMQKMLTGAWRINPDVVKLYEENNK